MEIAGIEPGSSYPVSNCPNHLAMAPQEAEFCLASGIERKPMFLALHVSRLSTKRSIWRFTIEGEAVSVVVIKVNRIRPTVVNKSINLGTTNPRSFDLALKVRSCIIINPMHCQTSLKKVAELWCHQGTFAACLCLLFLECPTLLYKLWWS